MNEYTEMFMVGKIIEFLYVATVFGVGILGAVLMVADLHGVKLL